jgi:UPF0716 protein FxsA
MSDRRAIAAGRRRSLLPLVVVTLVVVPILEVWLLIQVGQQIGVVWTLAILVVEALLGGWLLRREGRRAWSALNESFGTGRMPTRELTDAALVLVGGVLLMLPGFATDLIGLFCLLPFTRPLARRLLGWLVAGRVSELAGSVPQFDGMGPLLGGVPRHEGGRGPRGSYARDGVIEGETIEGEVEDPRS